MCCKLVSSPTLSHFSSIILLQVATYYQGPNACVRIPKNPKAGTHLCGSMSLSLLEGKGVEQGNLYATIVIQNTQVPIPE
jgi:hypothetical protein